MNRLCPILICSLAGCSGHNHTKANADFGPDASASVDAAKPRLTEAQTAQVVLSLDSGEVEVSNAVLSKLTNGDIQSFANEMITAPGQAKNDATALFAAQKISPEASPSSRALEDSASMLSTQLSSEGTPDRDYMNSQVVMHAQALMLIDCVLRPSVTNSAFSSLLQTMRVTVADHLAMAKMLGGTAPFEGPDGGAADCANLCTTAGGLPEALRNALCQ